MASAGYSMLCLHSCCVEPILTHLIIAVVQRSFSSLSPWEYRPSPTTPRTWLREEILSLQGNGELVKGNMQLAGISDTRPRSLSSSGPCSAVFTSSVLILLLGLIFPGAPWTPWRSLDSSPALETGDSSRDSCQNRDTL